MDSIRSTATSQACCTTGWTALLRALDGFDDSGLEPIELANAGLLPELLKRRDALFGRWSHRGS
jgi:hypothetical protein